ncbi:sugar phosphate isomerase/epimerase family protein [Arenibacter certesii]|uniref:Xylose isomerase-like TIM barrel domain-containing protein n=1 Tax=Arenibacter certesii TaxID=228955 RepID=A0A918J6S9_9FLAO|nr:TIM barrel protein [Arenibacter certesii]GGW47614.1 hypothetical protein GCM10007383_34610 [Arenibacter certesii]
MNSIKTFIILLFSSISISLAQEKVLFFQTDWGNQLNYDAFCERVKDAGYDGIEVWRPSKRESQTSLKEAIAKHGLKLIFLHGTNKGLPFKESLEDYKNNLEEILKWNPILVNCHTGSDFYTYEENHAFIEAANSLSTKYNIPVYHETHRGRFSYSLPETNKYLTQNPELKLTLDVSHWMVVHESLLQGKENLLAPVIDRTHHIHARIGHAQGPQVNDPTAPEWTNALEKHLDIWEAIIKKGWKEHKGIFTVTTEFGPADYMPTLPYTRLPLSDQWKANVFMMEAIKERLKLSQ